MHDTRCGWHDVYDFMREICMEDGFVRNGVRLRRLVPLRSLLKKRKLTAVGPLYQLHVVSCVCIDITREVKGNRHGIPFGLYTSGITKAPDTISSELKTEIGLSSIQVSLLSYTPDKYASLRQNQDKSQAQREFGQVCNFIVNAAESGFPVVAAVAGGEHAKGASELAKALGAVEVVVYDVSI